MIQFWTSVARMGTAAVASSLAFLLSVAPWICPMHSWQVFVPKGVLQSYHSPNQNLSVVSHYLWTKPEHLNLGFKVLLYWVIFQPVCIEYQLDAVHCAGCWRPGSLMGRKAGPNWTLHYRVWHSKQSYITQCLCMCVSEAMTELGKALGKKGSSI